MRRPSGSLLFSLGLHGAIALALANAAFHYDFSSSGIRRPPPAVEKITYVTVAPSGGVTGGRGASAPAKSVVAQRGLVAPVRVPTQIAPAAPAAPPVSGTPGGAVDGTGVGGGIGAATGVVPNDPDPRLSTDAHQFIPIPKSHGQRVDSTVRALVFAFNDSVTKAAAIAGRKPGDWTFAKGDQKWGIDGNKIYLGKFSIPSAVLAALPLRIQGNPGETIADRLVTTRRGEVLEHAQSRYHDGEFKSAVKRIRERKDRERRERLIAEGKAGQE